MIGLNKGFLEFDVKKKCQTLVSVLRFADKYSIAGKCVQSVDETERNNEEKMKKVENYLFEKLGLAI